MALITNKLRKDSSRPIYYKSIDLVSELKADSESRTISGYAAIWNNIDSARDMLLKGCCGKSITERGPESSTNRKIAYLWQHNMSEPIGRITKLVEDDKGLYFEAVIDKVPKGDQCLEQLKSGTLNQFSIGYQYVWDNCEWDSAKDCFVVKEIKLFEISVVTLGCNEETAFTGMKSEQLESERNQLLRETETAIKALPYEEQIKIRQLITKHIALAEAESTISLKEGSKPPKNKVSIDFKTLGNILKTTN